MAPQAKIWKQLEAIWSFSNPLFILPPSASVRLRLEILVAELSPVADVGFFAALTSEMGTITPIPGIAL